MKKDAMAISTEPDHVTILLDALQEYAGKLKALCADWERSRERLTLRFVIFIMLVAAGVSIFLLSGPFEESLWPIFGAGAIMLVVLSFPLIIIPQERLR